MAKKVAAILLGVFFRDPRAFVGGVKRAVLKHLFGRKDLEVKWI